ncbi:MAG: hypothetical protein LBR24_04275 [Methanobrevibacter sp.]|nr:hypothetical protein [Methanobrevibacter sp.]
MLCFSLTRLRKDFGWLTSGIFGFCIITMPKMMIYATQIRMYSWVMFFATISFYYAYKLLKQANNKNWIIFTIFNLLTIYTHYYGAIAIVFIYLFLILKNKNLINKWFLSAITLTSIYIPWVFLFLKKTVFGDNQWSKSTFQDIPNTIWFIFSPHYHDLDMTVLGIIFLITFIILIIYYISQIIKDKKNSSSLINGGFIVLIATMSFGCLFSVLIRPMFYPKYVFVVIGCFWLSFSVLLSKTYNSRKRIFVPILIFLIFVGICNSITFINSENVSKFADFEFKNYLNQISENDTIIYIGPQLMDRFFHFYLNNSIIYWWDNPINSTIANITEKLHDGKVWVFYNGNNGFPDINGGISSFNTTLIENGLKLGYLGEIKLTKFITYPRYLYTVNF